jgi:uncharacterized protein YjbI with pentapeptide repeats
VGGSARQAASLLLAVGFLLHTNPAEAGETADCFRYNAQLKKCVNDQREEGLNQPSRDERDNECADYRGKLVMYLHGDDSNFRGANFDGAQFRYVNFMTGADLTGASLRNIIGDMMDLNNANLSDADLSNARLKPCPPPGLSGVCLAGARFDAGTLLPFSREEALARGMVAVDEKK